MYLFIHAWNYCYNQGYKRTSKSCLIPFFVFVLRTLNMTSAHFSKGFNWKTDSYYPWAWYCTSDLWNVYSSSITEILYSLNNFLATCPWQSSFFYDFIILDTSYNWKYAIFYLSVTGLFHLGSCTQISSMLSHMVGFPSFLMLSNSRLYVYTTISLSIRLPVDI